MYSVFSHCVSTQYDSRMPMSHGKYDRGRGVSPIELPNVVNGMQIPIAMIEKVMNITGHEAELCMNGTLRVRIMCTISVCESKLSINHPDWNSDSISGPWHLNTHHIIIYVAMSNIELIGPIHIMKRLRSAESHTRGLRRYSLSIRSNGIVVWDMS